jgi:SAM-dependent methyltransferase
MAPEPGFRCPACAGEALPYLSQRDRNLRVSRDRFDYLRCDSCGLIFLTPVPNDLDRYYPVQYFALPRSRTRLTELAGRERFKLDLIRPFEPVGDLLEIGPGWGSFAYAAKLAGYSVTVVEKDERCRTYLEEVAGVAVRAPKSTGALPDGLETYDVVALWHVLEHLPDFRQMLVDLAGRVRPGGVLAIATPNPGAWQFRLMGAAWPHLDAPRHLQLIPADLVKKILRPLGFEPVIETTGDAGGLRWNRFGWQRLMMNALPRSRLLGVAGLVAGYAIGWLLAPLDRRSMQGAAYTMVLRRSGEDRPQGAKTQTGSIDRMSGRSNDA